MNGLRRKLRRLHNMDKTYTKEQVKKMIRDAQKEERKNPPLARKDKGKK